MVISYWIMFLIMFLFLSYIYVSASISFCASFFKQGRGIKIGTNAFILDLFEDVLNDRRSIFLSFLNFCGGGGLLGTASWSSDMFPHESNYYYV